jgi:hypothetical protein
MRSKRSVIFSERSSKSISLNVLNVRPNMSKTYDTQCYDLAAAFLDEVPKATEKDISDLAGEIQETIENFIADVESRETPQSKETT